MKGIIYKYTFPDGKVYIGQTRRHPEKRKQEHLNALVGPTNSGFWEAYKKYGEPKYDELYAIELDNVDELVHVLNIMETRYIRLYKADHQEYGYNRTSSGTVGTGANNILRKKYKELVTKLSKERLKVYNSAVEKIWKTKEPLTSEEKYLIKEKYRKENIYQNYLDNLDLNHLTQINFDKEMDFMVEEALEFVHFMITDEIQEEVSSYISENYLQIIDEERSKSIIVQLDKEGHIIREFSSFNEIGQAFNIIRTDNVRNVLKGKQKSAYGYYWKYKKDLLSNSYSDISSQ